MNERVAEFLTGMGGKVEAKPEDEQTLQESGLTPKQLMHLRIESQGIRDYGLKESLIRDHIGVSMTKHAQVIYHLTKNPAAYAHNNGEFAPMLNRVSRGMEERSRRSSGRRLLDER